MHYHAQVTVTVSADSLPELIAELGTGCAHVPNHLNQVADEWTTLDPKREQAMKFTLAGTAATATGVLSAHIDPTEN